LEIAASHNIDLGKIYAIGKPQRLPERIGFLTWLLDGVVIPKRAVPKKFQVETLPAWIVETKEGKILLEGMSDLASRFNSRGELTEEEVVKRLRPGGAEEGEI